MRCARSGGNGPYFGVLRSLGSGLSSFQSCSFKQLIQTNLSMPVIMSAGPFGYAHSFHPSLSHNNF